MTEGALPGRLVQSGEVIPTFAFPETPARVLARAWSYACWREKPPGRVLDFEDADSGQARVICEKALVARGAGWLTSEETRSVLTAMHLPLATGGVVQTAQAAIELARTVGYPVAVKLASHDLVHKTEIGGVHLNVADDAGVQRAFEQIRQRLEATNQLAAMEGVLVQPMLGDGIEVMIGVTQDPRFGPLLAFGLGGIHVEILGDVCFRLAPLTDRDAREMVRGIRGFRLLEGYRGHPAADSAALEQALLRISRLVEEVPEITELDLNPVFALAPGKGCRIVDARICIGSPQAAGR
jgi:acyl-CoA synthetase (NDP forming)